MTLRDLPEILRGGYCTRWHANPDLAHVRETLAEHHARVAQILLALHPSPSRTLIDAALHHDAGEPFCGDLPAPFKAAHPEVAEVHAEAEDLRLADLGCLISISVKESAWLHFADRLAAYAHVAQVRPDLLTRPDWREARAALVTLARELMDEPNDAAALLARLEGKAVTA